MKRSLLSCYAIIAFGLTIGGLTTKVAEAGNDKDERGVIMVRGHAGVAIDNFAADTTKTYLNYNESGASKNRNIFGFDMAYRLFGDQTVILSNGFTHQLWLYGSTMHGMRSAEVDCDAHPNLTVCSNKLPTTSNPNDNIYMLRNASSLEAMAGLRYEFYTMQAGTNAAANLYVNAQAGFLTIANNGGDVVDMHQVGIGAVVINGPFRNSYFEVGRGRSDVFLSNQNKRIKISAKAEFTPELMGKYISWFAKMTSDVDGGNGADSIQTYIGVSFNFDNLF